MTSNVIAVRQMNENDLEQADKIMKLAFGTFLGLPEPISFIGDADYVHTRYHADPSAALVAEIDGKIVGSNGLFTFAQSAKNVYLYQKFGFWSRFLTAIMSKSVSL
jgi:hypothetical protein